ncbi:MAG: hypothetical protein KIT09_02600 [Bryobacteraceae bacterium]|nr:hypothetical protein [Bryobacteraceae bacterium]
MSRSDQFKKLSLEARKFYDRVKHDWNIHDAAGLLTLLTACQALDRLRQAQGILAAEGIVLTDRFGQPKPHPATQVEKEARAGLLASIKALDLDVAELQDV